MPMMRPRLLLPLAGVIAFIIMISVAEMEVRSSPKWPPPAKHELGAWTIDDPPLLRWATGVNLPASVPILWMWAHSDRFAYAFDDHRLIVYVPWIPLVGLLWYFVGLRLEHFTRRQQSNSSVNRYVIFCSQIVITIELFYLAIGLPETPGTNGRTTVLVFFWLWVLVAILGWLDVVLSRESDMWVGPKVGPNS